MALIDFWGMPLHSIVTHTSTKKHAIMTFSNHDCVILICMERKGDLHKMSLAGRCTQVGSIALHNQARVNAFSAQQIHRLA
jgi:hypothetical protein